MPPSSSSYITTHHVILQTSRGVIVVGLYGADFPATTAHFINLARAQLFQGAVMTAVVPDHAVVFSQALADGSDYEDTEKTLRASSNRDGTTGTLSLNTLSLPHGLPICSYCTAADQSKGTPDNAQNTPFNFFTIAAAMESKSSEGQPSGWGETGKGFHEKEVQLHTAMKAEFNTCKQKRRYEKVHSSSHRKPSQGSSTEPILEWEWISAGIENPTVSSKATGSLHRKGLLFVPAPCSMNQASQRGSGIDFFGITLTDRQAGGGNALDRGHIAIGEIMEGWEVLDQLRREPHGPLVSFSSSSSGVKPVQRAAYADWPRPLRMTRVFDLQCVPLCGCVPIWKLKEAAHNPSLFIQNSPSGSFENRVRTVALRTLDRMRDGVTFIAPTESVILVNRAVLQLLRVEPQERITATDPSGRPRHNIPLVIFRPVDLDAMLSRLPPVKAMKEQRGQHNVQDLEEDSLEVRRRERHWRQAWNEEGVQRLIANPQTSGPFLPSDSDNDEDDFKSHKTAYPSAEFSRDSVHLTKQKQVVESLSLAMHILDDIPLSSSSVNAKGEVQLVEPCERTLFVCRLNAVTTSEGLAECFSSFGPVLSCNVIRDPKTGASLRYAFVEFSTKEACYAAYQKMNHVLIDDSRIVTEFSQSIRKSVQHHFNAEKKQSLSSNLSVGEKRQRE